MPEEIVQNQTQTPTSSLTQEALELIKIFATPDEEATESVTGSIKVSTAATLPALFYEKIRNIIEYHEDHLLRRAAIERILERLTRTKNSTHAVAETLIRELLWARYLKNESIPLTKIDEIDKIIQKYQKFTAHNKEQAEWLRSIESYDIERTLVETFKKEAMVSFMYQIFAPRIKLDGNLSEEEKNVQIFIACHRALARSDEAILRYFLLHLRYPHPETVENMTTCFNQIESQIQDHANTILTRHLRKNIAPFLLLEDSLRKDSKIETYGNPEKLESSITEVANARYHQLRSKIARMATRSIIYIFITKMLVAFLFEIPSDLWITKDFRILSLLINISFPPFTMFALTLPVKAPGKDNTERVIKRIKNMIYVNQKENTPLAISLKPRQYGPILAIFLTGIYLLAFIVSFGLILKSLTILKFNILSKIVFVLFLSGIAFFAYQIRQVAKDYKVSDREGFLSPVADFFMVPILSVGQWVGKGLARFNFLTYIFDFIIEAPLKTIIEVFEELTHFLREKREEVV